ncbi:MAG: YbaB/EbfC family nucleoid-associated protein [Verrucomicrobia bacterium]|nr:YbaB/EbfC family nucleoid-associated protein [Verrucomicrobiota bacterium]
MANLGKLFKQATRIQQQIQAAQESLAQRTVEAASGGGAVKVVARCDETIQSIKIDPKAIDPEDPEMLEDLVLAAVNSALEKAKATAKEELSKAAGGLPLPGFL